MKRYYKLLGRTMLIKQTKIISLIFKRIEKVRSIKAVSTIHLEQKEFELLKKNIVDDKLRDSVIDEIPLGNYKIKRI